MWAVWVARGPSGAAEPSAAPLPSQALGHPRHLPLAPLAEPVVSERPPADSGVRCPQLEARARSVAEERPLARPRVPQEPLERPPPLADSAVPEDSVCSRPRLPRLGPRLRQPLVAHLGPQRAEEGALVKWVRAPLRLARVSLFVAFTFERISTDAIFCFVSFSSSASSSPAFGAGGFGASTGGAFGAPASASAFGGAQSSPAFGGAFGAAGGAGASAPGFGLAGSAPSFGAFGGSMPASAPGFGGFSSASALGATAAPGMFGAASAGASTFGSTFSTQQQLALGGMSAPGFGASGGMFGAPAASGGMFGAQASAPAFGAFGAAPGASAPTAGLFGNLGAAKPIMPAASFGSQPVMGALGAAPTLGGLGGSTPSFSFAGAGAPAAPGTSLFAASASTLGGMATTPVLGGAAAGAPSLFGASGATPLQAGAQPGQAGTPYGQLPQLPAPTATLTPGTQQTPQSADAANGKRSVGTGIASASRTAHTMLSPRLITPRSAMRMRPRRSPQSQSATPLGGPNLSQGGLMASPQQKMGATWGRIQSSPRPAAPIEDTVIVARENPRKLFVREAVVSPFSAGGSSLHSMASPGGSAGAQQPPSGGRGLGPAKTVVASRTKIGSDHVNGGGGRITSASPLNGSASKELNFLSPESAYGVSSLVSLPACGSPGFLSRRFPVGSFDRIQGGRFP